MARFLSKWGNTGCWGWGLLVSGFGATDSRPIRRINRKVTRVENYRVFVSTAKGDGLVPVRELGLAPGADLRKAFPLGKELTVVVMDVDDRGRIRFSAKEVLRVEEQKNFREFTEAAARDGAEAEPCARPVSKADKPKVDRGPRNFGSLGNVVADKLKHLAAKNPATPPNKGK